VIRTATGDDILYLKSIRVDEVIDYKRERFEDKVHDVDAVVDLVGGDTAARSYGVVKRGGVLVSTVQAPDEAAAQRTGIRAERIVMKRNSADLAELAQLVAKGAVRPRMDKTLSLSQAKEAQALSEEGKTEGKVILKVA
jgi:NADPH:quinone reductase-like Zn-dependent oxidoreductase